MESEIPISFVDVFWKYLRLFVRNKSMHDGLFRSLKQVGSSLRFLRLLTLENLFKQLYFNSELKSPNISKLLCFR